MSQTILIVDDSVTVRQVTRWVVESEGHTALEAGSMREAVQQLEGQIPTTILVDYQLPEGAGVEFVRQLRGQAKLDGVRVIVLYGDYHPFDPNAALAAGASGVLKKPFRSNQLFDALKVEVSSSDTAPIAVPVPDASTPAAGLSVADAMSAASDAHEAEGRTERHQVLSGARELGSDLLPPPAPQVSGAHRVTQASGSIPLPPPPTPGQSGLHRVGATTQSGLHRLPPPPGRPGVPRVPTGQHRAVSEESFANIRPPARLAEGSVPTRSVEPIAPTPAQTRPVEEIPAQTRPVEEIPAPAIVAQPQHVTPRREQITAEVDPLRDKDLMSPAPAADTAPAATAITEEQLRQIVAEMLPSIARQALAGLLKSELNEQVVRMGVMKRVSQFLDEDLPRYAQQAIERRVNERKDL